MDACSQAAQTRIAGRRLRGRRAGRASRPASRAPSEDGALAGAAGARRRRGALLLGPVGRGAARLRALPGALPAQRRPPGGQGAGPGERRRGGGAPAARRPGAGGGARAAARLRAGGRRSTRWSRQALLGRGEPELALDRVRHLATMARRTRSRCGPRRWRCSAAGTSSTRRSPTRSRAPGIEELPRVDGPARPRPRHRRRRGARSTGPTAAFAALGCRFEHARCLELAGDLAAAREVYERLGAIPALERVGV